MASTEFTRAHLPHFKCICRTTSSTFPETSRRRRLRRHCTAHTHTVCSALHTHIVFACVFDNNNIVSSHPFNGCVWRMGWCGGVGTPYTHDTHTTCSNTRCNFLFCISLFYSIGWVDEVEHELCVIRLGDVGGGGGVAVRYVYGFFSTCYGWCIFQYKYVSTIQMYVCVCTIKMLCNSALGYFSLVS